MKKMQNGFSKMATIYIVVGLFVAVTIGVLIARSPKSTPAEVLSQNGLHWHSNLTILVKGVKQDLPANIGVSSNYMSPVHTHETDGIIHLEFSGVVLKKDTMLGVFFKNWGKDIHSLGVNLKMTVNGVENTELDNYYMKDGDKIELKYE